MPRGADNEGTFFFIQIIQTDTRICFAIESIQYSGLHSISLFSSIPVAIDLIAKHIKELLNKWVPSP